MSKTPPPFIIFIVIPVLSWLAGYLSKAVDPEQESPPVSNLIYGLPLAAIIGFLVWHIAGEPDRVNGVYSGLLVMVGYTQHWGIQKFGEALKAFADTLLEKLLKR